MIIRPRSPIIAASLSILTPGLGHIYNGQIKKGAIIIFLGYSIAGLLLILGLFHDFSGLIFSVLLGLFYHIFFAVNAAYTALKIKEFQPNRFNNVYFYILVAVLHLFFSMSARRMTAYYILRPFNISTGSMEPTIRPGDYVMVDLRIYQKTLPQPGHIIIFKSNVEDDMPWIKRCIASEGKTVEIRDKILFVDGTVYPDSQNTKHITKFILPKGYNEINISPPNAGNRDNYGPVIVPDNHFFVLGDNRDHTLDSRYVGFIDKKRIFGKVLYLLWANDKSRIGKRY
jgi:signal peptidase I